MSRYRFPPFPAPLGRDGNGTGSGRTAYPEIGFPVDPASPKWGWHRELGVG